MTADNDFLADDDEDLQDYRKLPYSDAKTWYTDYRFYDGLTVNAVLAEVDSQDDKERRHAGRGFDIITPLRWKLNKAGHDILDAAGILCKERTEELRRRGL